MLGDEESVLPPPVDITAPATDFSGSHFAISLAGT
jgi:hypothetical protein